MSHLRSDHLLVLHVWTPNDETRQVLRDRAAAYVARKDSGFDLEVYDDDVHEFSTQPVVLLPTRVHAMVVSHHEGFCERPYTIEPTACHAFTLNARSSLPGRGWMLGNGIGIIDKTYRDQLKAFLVATPANRGITTWQYLVETRVVQIMAHDVQPFDRVVVCESQEEWQRLVDRFAVSAPNRGGGFGSTGNAAAATPPTEIAVKSFPESFAAAPL